MYHDRQQCRSAARSFSLIHEKKADECWLIIHGYIKSHSKDWMGLAVNAVTRFAAGAAGERQS